jgi:hypothetical protein
MKWVEEWLHTLGQQPPWIVVALVGAVIGLLLPGLLRVPLWALGLFRRHPLQGVWHHFWYNFDTDEPRLKHEQWRVKRGFRGPLRVKTRSTVAGEPRYSGYIEFENEFALVHLKARGHNEQVHHRHPLPVPGADRILVGMVIAQDYGGLSSAHASVLARRELTEAQVKALLAQRVRQENEYALMRVERH